MKKNIKDQILQLIPTIWEGVLYAKDPHAQHAVTVLGDCGDAVHAIKGSMATELSEQEFIAYEEIFAELNQLLEAIHDRVTSGSSASELAFKFKSQLGLLEERLAQEPLDKLEIVFMPYKSSMWDSLESIWMAAKEDERCNATVVPIPYYDRNPDRSLGEFRYEIEQFPDYVPVVHFDSYDLSARRPDVIFIHNPYDDQNVVTTVDPRFYSQNLRPFTGMLVYVPYFISGAYANVQTFAHKHLTACVNNVDKIVVQSETHKKLYLAAGVDETKLLALGSPKLDTYFYKSKDNTDIPAIWESKLYGKKAIVLNSSIGAFLNNSDYLTKLKQRMATILSYAELALIWRPHPLLETTITSMRPDLYDEYRSIIEFIKDQDHAVLDLSANTEPATLASSGMISDISSWARQYISTGKPVLLLQGSGKVKSERVVVFDHFSSYFLNDGWSIEDFCRMIISGEDHKREDRLRDIKNSIANSDGSCGIKIHQQVTSLLGD